MRHIGEVATEAIQKMKAKANSGGNKVSKKKQKISQEEIRDKYQDQIDSLDDIEADIWDSMKDHKRNRILVLLNKLNNNKFFGKSTPEIDLPFVIMVQNQHGLRLLRNKLNDMYTWLVANPNKRKKNYRRFILNWLKSEDFDKQIIINKDN